MKPGPPLNAEALNDAAHGRAHVEADGAGTDADGRPLPALRFGCSLTSRGFQVHGSFFFG